MLLPSANSKDCQRRQVAAGWVGTPVLLMMQLCWRCFCCCRAAAEKGVRAGGRLAGSRQCGECIPLS